MRMSQTIHQSFTWTTSNFCYCKQALVKVLRILSSPHFQVFGFCTRSGASGPFSDAIFLTFLRNTILFLTATAPFYISNGSQERQLLHPHTDSHCFLFVCLFIYLFWISNNTFSWKELFDIPKFSNLLMMEANLHTNGMNVFVLT